MSRDDSPLQIASGPVTLNIGRGITRKVVYAFEMQPILLEPVTVYVLVEFGETDREELVVPSLQVYVTAPFAIRFADFPEHRIESPVSVTVGVEIVIVSIIESTPQVEFNISFTK